MDYHKIISKIPLPGWLIMLGFFLTSCDTTGGMMHDNGSMGSAGWGVWPILVGIGFVLLLGFVIWLAVTKRNR